MSDVDVMDRGRDERQSALDDFARAGEGSGRREVVVPQQAFGVGGDRIIGAQEVAVYRDEGKVLAKIKALAAAAGADWYYRYPVKNRKENRTDWIEGPSIKLANDVARLYGNCDVDVRVVDGGDSWIFYARFTDYETGFSLTRPFQQDKAGAKLGGGDDARKRDIAFQIGVSKAERNVVANALQTFADFAFEEARGAIVEKIGKNLDKYRRLVLERLESQKIDARRAEAIVGRPSAEWLAPDVSKIIAMIKAVGDGMATWDESFPPIAATPDKPPAQADQAKPADLDSFAAENPAAGEAAQSAPVEATPAATTPAAEEARPVMLSQPERNMLRELHGHLSGAMTPKTIDKGLAAFLDDKKVADGSLIHKAAVDIAEGHRRRATGAISPVEADELAAKVLA